MFNIDHFIDLYIEVFPNEASKINEHIELNGAFLGHIFFDEEICSPLCNMIRHNVDKEGILKLVDLIEVMLFEGDAYVQSVVKFGILKKIKAEKDILNMARGFFKEETVETIRVAWHVS